MPRDHIRSVATLCYLLVTLLLAHVTHAQSNDTALVARGQYIFDLAGGCACHSDPEGTLNAGARPFPIPLGTVYSTNITQDKETGLGSWTDRQIHDAMVKGIRPDGRRILPVMPFPDYSGMAQEDLKALIAYLRTMAPVSEETPPLKSWIPFLRRVVMPLYVRIFARFSTAPVAAPKAGIERGKYLVDHVSLCGDCHTPKNLLGAPIRSLYMAGVDQRRGPLGEAVPNITPDEETGIGEWSREEIAEVLISGIKADLDYVGGLMAEVVEHGYKNMTKEDALAIADYLKSIPAIRNEVY